eukprot:1120785-Rhodomonas_salina.1
MGSFAEAVAYLVGEQLPEASEQRVACYDTGGVGVHKRGGRASAAGAHIARRGSCSTRQAEPTLCQGVQHRFCQCGNDCVVVIFGVYTLYVLCEKIICELKLM